MTQAQKEAYLKQQYSNMVKNELNPGQQRALVQYSGKSFGPLNEALRTGQPLGTESIIGPSQQTTATLLDGILAQHPLADDMTLYRGMDGSMWSQFQASIGKTMTDNAYVSTSASKSVANKFANSPTDVLMSIQAPKGTPGTYLAPVSKYAWEKEMLLGRGMNYKVISATVVNGQRQVVVQIVK